MTTALIRSLAASTLLAAFSAPVVAASISGFDDLPLSPQSHYFPAATTTFSSGAASFGHAFTDFGFGCCWEGWTYSNRTDTTTPGFGNQFSAIAGGGAAGTANYGIAFFGVPDVSFASAVRVEGAYFTNTTYAALSMANGDGFAKKFGGASGNDPDFFRLTITGWNGTATTRSVVFDLADFTFADNAQDYIVNAWTFVDLSSLGAVTKLEFALTSSDNGAFGINTPTYFAMDELSVSAVPEPSEAALILAGLALVAFAARRRRR